MLQNHIVVNQGGKLRLNHLERRRLGFVFGWEIYRDKTKRIATLKKASGTKMMPQ